MLIRARRIIGGIRAWASRGSLWLPSGNVVPARHNVLVPDGRGGVLASGSNLVTQAGAERIAELYAAEAATNAFDAMELISAGSLSPTMDRSDVTVISSTESGFDTGYPKTSDSDPDNPWGGPRTVTYKVTYAAGSFTEQAVLGGIITNATPGASEPLLAAWHFDEGSITLPTGKPIFVNHPIAGV